MSGADETGRTLRLERFIPSSPNELFTLWIEPEHVARWWAPDGYKAAVHDLDVRPGGRWRIVLRGSGGRELAMGGSIILSSLHSDWPSPGRGKRSLERAAVKPRSR